MKNLLVTGAAGFIGANFVLDWLASQNGAVVSLDALTYAGNLANLASVRDESRHTFVKGSICDSALLDRLFAEHRFDAVVHFAAESHVDRSIHGPRDFIETNINGTFTLLEAARKYWAALAAPEAIGSDSCMSPPMRSLAHLAQPTQHLPKIIRTSPIAPIRRPRPAQTIWCGPGTIPMDCRF